MPIYGVMVPFHILTIKNATNNQARFLGLPTCRPRPVGQLPDSWRAMTIKQA